MKAVNWDLLSKYLANECSEQESEMVQDWLQASATNRKYFEEVKSIWEAAGTQEVLQEPDLQLAWNKVDRATSYRRISPVYSHYWRIAASFLIVTLLGILIYFSAFRSGQILVTTSANETRDLLLADGSRIWLNESSSLAYPEEFDGKSREVSLKGEAFFDITPDKEKPFQVSTGNSITKVLGTSFNIREIPSDGVEIQVVSGKVSFYEKKTEARGILLQAGEKGKLALASLTPVKKHNDDANFLSWHTGTLNFKGASLKEVIPQLERYYKKRIVLENEELYTCMLTSSFEKRSIDEILQTLQAIYGLSYEIKGNLIYLRGGSC